MGQPMDNIRSVLLCENRCIRVFLHRKSKNDNGSRQSARGSAGEMFVVASEIKALDDPFYRALNELLANKGLDEFAEGLCREFHADSPGSAEHSSWRVFPDDDGGLSEGIGSERRFAWRCRNSSSLHEFLGYGLAKTRRSIRACRRHASA